MLYVTMWSEKMGITKKYIDDLTYEIIGCCINVHKELGAGLLESIYHQMLNRRTKIPKYIFFF